MFDHQFTCQPLTELNIPLFSHKFEPLVSKLHLAKGRKHFWRNVRTKYLLSYRKFKKRLHFPQQRFMETIACDIIPFRTILFLYYSELTKSPLLQKEQFK